MRVSCTKLAKLMVESEIPWSNKNKITPKFLRNRCEAYGSNVQCYIQFKDMKERADFERWCRQNKITYNYNYCRHSGNCRDEFPVAEVSVTYFKAWHWDE